MNRLVRFCTLLLPLLASACAGHGAAPPLVALRSDAAGFSALGPVSYSSLLDGSRMQLFQDRQADIGVAVMLADLPRQDLAAGLRSNAATAALIGAHLATLRIALQMQADSIQNRGIVAISIPGGEEILRCANLTELRGNGRRLRLGCVGLVGDRLALLLSHGPDNPPTYLRTAELFRRLRQAAGQPLPAETGPDATVVPEADATILPEPPGR